MKLVVLAAGAGTRMGPLTTNRSKAMLPIGGRPLLDYLLANARGAGMKEAIVVVHHHAQAIRTRYSAAAMDGIRVEFVDQGRPQGTGHALGAAASHLDSDFVLAAGDGYLSADDLKALAGRKGLAIGAHRVDDARPYGLLKTKDGHLASIDEKPASGGGLVNVGAYRLTPEVVEAAQRLTASPRGEKELTGVMMPAVGQGQAVEVVDCSSWRDVGRPWDLLTLQAQILADQRTRIDGNVGQRVDVEGPVVVEEGAQVLNGSRIEGPAWIGKDAKVGPNAYIRGATSIGAGCRVGAAVEIKNSILMDDTNVPHLSYVGDSIIGAGVNLGAGTNVANLKVNDRNVRVQWDDGSWIDTGRRKFGAVIGDGVKIGINCSLNPGSVVGAATVIGAGKVVTGWVPGGSRIV